MQQVLNVAFDATDAADAADVAAADTDFDDDVDARLKVMKQIDAEAKLKATEGKPVAR